MVKNVVNKRMQIESIRIESIFNTYQVANNYLPLLDFLDKKKYFSDIKSKYFALLQSYMYSGYYYNSLDTYSLISNYIVKNRKKISYQVRAEKRIQEN